MATTITTLIPPSPNNPNSTTEIIADYRWMSGGGGVLMDATGDISLTTTNMESIKDIIQSRLKADYRGWALYNIGADLQSFMGQVISSELTTSLSRRIISSLTSSFLPAGAISIRTLVTGDMVQAFVYVAGTMVATATTDKSGSTLTVVIL